MKGRFRFRGYGSIFVLVLTFLALSLPSNPYAEDTSQEKGLEIVSAVPRGTVEGIGEAAAITVTFNQPMVPLEQLPEGPGIGPLRLEPPVVGKYRWLGTSTLTFTPDERLPLATGFRATVPAGIKSITSQTLAKDYTWEFETLRPRVKRTIPRNKAKWVKLDEPLYAIFNQPVSPKMVKGFILLQELPWGMVRLSFKRPPEKEWKKDRPRIPVEHALVILPRRHLKAGKSYTLNFLPGLPGMEGPLGKKRPHSVTFSTYNEFCFLGLEKDELAPERPVTFKFSNPVSYAQLAAHVHFQPEVEIPEHYKGRDYWYRANPKLYLPFKPVTNYIITIDKGLKDKFGNRLGKKITVILRVGDYKPTVSMGCGPGIIEAYTDHYYPVSVVNIKEVGLQMAHLEPGEIVPLFKKKYRFSSSKPFPAEEGFWDVERIWRIETPKNEKKLLPLKLDEALGEKKYGIVFIQLDYLKKNLRPNERYRRRYQRALVQITELGITAKFSPFNNLIWVTRLSDAQPVAGAEVEIRDDENEVKWRGKTDEKGFARTPGWKSLGIKPKDKWSKPRQWVLVTQGEDVALSSSEWGTGIYPYRFGISYDRKAEPRVVGGHLFSERGIYRPGEEVHLKGIIRKKENGKWKITQEALDVRVTTSRGEELLKERITLSPYGSFSLTIPLPKKAPLGRYQVQARFPVEGEKAKPWKRWDINTVSTSFRVAAYRPAQFEVNVRPEREDYIFGDLYRTTLEARYLFGAPMSHQKITWKLTRRPSYFRPPGHRGYRFAGYYWWEKGRSRSGLVASGSAKLGQDGTFLLERRLDGKGYWGSATYILEGTVKGLSRQVISGRAGVTVHRGTFYLGMKPSTTFLEKGKNLKVNLIAVDREGKLLTGKNIRLSMTHRQWHSVRKAGVGGRYRWVSEHKDTKEAEVTIVSGEEPVAATFLPQQVGFYVLKAESEDERGNPLRTATTFYVTGKGYVAWKRSDDDRIELVADAEKYKPGEKARILIKSPYEKCIALVTLEREGIMDSRIVHLESSAEKIEVPITEEHIPNIFVSVILLQGRTATHLFSKEGDDIGKPSFKIGYVNLPVDPGTRRLKVEVKTDKKEYRPGGQVEVEVKVKDHSGKGVETEVTLAVVDLGVLKLIGYKTPDPFPYFYGQRPLSVQTSETRLHVVGQRNYGEKGEPTGGGGLLAESKIAVRGEFRTCAYWNPSLITDKRGNIRVSFKLPDNLTTFRVMSIAHTKDSCFGSADSSFTVNKLLMLRPALPRFVRIGDLFQAGVMVHNYSQKRARIELSVQAEGILLEGESLQSLELAPGEGKEILFSYRVENPGRATFIFRARMGKETDGVKISIPIHLPRSTETVALLGSTPKEHKEWLKVPENVLAGIGELDVTASSTALVGLERSADYLFSYPYGCLEQHLSRILPMILFGEVVDAFSLPGLEGRDYHEVVQETLNKIADFQLSNGGLAFWVDSAYDSPYVSAYTLFTLQKAKEAGYRVDEKMMKKIEKYLRNVLRGKVKRSYYPYDSVTWHCIDAFTLQALASVGIYEPAYVERLYNKRYQLPCFAQAMLLKAMHYGQGDRYMMKELRRLINNGMRIEATTVHFEEPDRGMGWIFHSNLRTTAAVLQTFLEVDGSHEQAEKMVRWLIQRRRGGRWRSTQENLYTFWALATYFQKYEKEVPKFSAQVYLAEKKVLEEIFKGRSLKTERKSISLKELKEGKTYPLLFQCKGQGRFYYGAWLSYAPDRDLPARDEGLAVFKSIETLEGKPVTENLFQAGEVYRVRLKVVTPRDRNFVVVDDPLPAGFEAVDTSLSIESKELAQRLWSFRREERKRRWWGSFDRTELGDDRVLIFADYLLAGVHNYSYLVRATTYGGFHMPATKAEEMYSPEVFGRNVGAKIEIR